MIDTHTHAWHQWIPDDVAKCFEITKARKILLAASPMELWHSDDTEGCSRLIARFPEQMAGLIGIHPPDVDKSLWQIDYYSKKGFVGVKLMPTVGYYPDDEKHRRVFEEVNARKMIVLTHCGWCSPNLRGPDLPQSTRFSHPDYIEPLARIYKDTDFILAHGGGRTQFQSAFDLVAYHSNVYVDTCPGNGTWVLQNAGAWLGRLNWDRVLFGTDACYGSIPAGEHGVKTEQFVRTTLINAGYASKVDAVLEGNAVRLLQKHGVEVGQT